MQATNMVERKIALSDLAIFMIATPLDFEGVNPLRDPQSPGAGEGAAGNMPDAGSLPAPDHFSTIKKMPGMKKIPIALAASIPPITAVPIIWRATEPAPLAVHSGTQPRIKANEVIRIGRSRNLAPSRAASASGLPCSY